MNVEESAAGLIHKGSRPTLKTIADACGLAVTTVSRALNDGDDISLKTRNNVKSIADQLGYVPNRAGRGLRTGRSHMISLLVSPHAAVTGYTSAIFSGIGEVCRQSGYELSATPDYPHLDELSAIRSIVQNKVADGIIISRIKPQDIRVRYLLECGFPFVTHGRTELASSHAYIDFDNQQFTEIGASRLAKRGRQRLLLIGAPEGLTYGNHMKVGFERAAARSNVSIVATDSGIDLETPLDKLRTYTQSLYDTPGKCPDGIVCGSELAAMAILAGIRDAGLTPAHDVDVFAKQTSAALDYVFPAIDTCIENIRNTGQLLGQTLLNTIEQRSSGVQPEQLTGQLIEPEIRFRT